MTQLFYPLSTGASFPFRPYLNISTVEYTPDTVTFPQGALFGDCELEWENRERLNQTIIQPSVIEHLKSDPTSRIFSYCGLETLGEMALDYRITQLTKWGIRESQIHYIVASQPQVEIIQQLNSSVTSSAFNHWEIYTGVKTQRWDTDLKPQRKFLFLNRRNSYERLTLAYLLLNNSKIKAQTNYSLHPSIYWTRQTRSQELAHFREVIQQINPKYRNEISRWCLTTPWRSIPGHNRTDPYRYDIIDADSEYLIKNHSLSIITESHPYHSDREFMPTEKTMRAIAAGRPFVTLGTQHFLRNLRSQGYETFGEYWNEDYDSEPDITRRLEMIYETVIEINKLSIEQIHAITRKVCEHNRQQLIARIQSQNIKLDLDPILAQYVDFDTPRCPS